MLCERFDRDFFVSKLVDNRESYLFPSIMDRESWEKVKNASDSKEQVEEIIAAAKEILGQSWPQLSASMFSEFFKNGNRINYHNAFFKKRNDLGLLVIAECLEDNGEYIEEMVKGIWAILSEPCWNVPAHGKYLDGDCLPDPDQVWVDLFAGTTAMTLSLTMMLAGRKLWKYSPALCKRLSQTLLERIIEPIEQHPEYHNWMYRFNNWTPWCASNIIGTALYVIEDKERIADLIMQLLKPTDSFIATYAPDGGCDEGPRYWGLAGGKLFEQLEILNSVTGGGMEEIYKEPLIKNMGEYIAKVHLAGKWFLSPADSYPRCRPRRALMSRFGKRIKSSLLQQFALWFSPDKKSITDEVFCGNLLLFTLESLFWVPEKTSSQSFEHETTTIFDDLEILIARDTSCEGGFIMASKGGHNAESHNHNDIGVFEVFYDNTPVLIDIGTGIYTKQTFSADRYGIWYISSNGHNVPQINGKEQLAGEECKASSVNFETTPDKAAMLMDISSAYPAECNLSSMLRNAALYRSLKTVSIHDRATFTKAGNKLVMPLYFLMEPKITGPDTAEIKVNDKVLQLDINCSHSLCMEVEKIVLGEDKLLNDWGECIYKLSLEIATEGDSISYDINLRKK